MKALVIGGAGYIGSHVVYELIRDGNEVIVLDNLSTGKKSMVHKSATFYMGDINNKEDLIKVFSNEKIDVVMHFAAKLIVPDSVKMPLEYYYNNVEGVRQMLEVMTEYHVKKIVFSSTAAVYGDPVKPVCEENDLKNPINPYGESKLAAENMIKWVCEAYNMNYCIFRYFNVAGADYTLDIGLDKENLTHLIPIINETILSMRKNIKIMGDNYNTPDGTCIRDYIHVSDLAQAHILGAKFIIKNQESLLINLGSNNGYSVKEVINTALKHGKIDYLVGDRRKGDPAKLIASNYKAKNILGWVPKYTLDDMIKSDLEFRRKINNK